MFGARKAVACITVSLALLHGVFAQTFVESKFLPIDYGYGQWSDPTKWSPAEVPNDTPTRFYNVSLTDKQVVGVDVDATIHNLTATGRSGFQLFGHNLTVTETSRFESAYVSISGGTFKTGNLVSNPQAGVLTGSYSIGSYDGQPALMQFNGAHVTSLQDAQLTLLGNGAIVDENGTNALRDLALIDTSSELDLDAYTFVTSAPVRIDGTLSLTGYAVQPTTFVATTGLANFDANSRTLSGGTFMISGADGSDAPPVELRFAGADIVNNASSITLSYASGRIADLNGLDALRNFARNMRGGEFTLLSRAFVVPQDFTNDGTLRLNDSTFTIAGSLLNVDPTTHTLRGGAFVLDDQSALQFPNADIVHNAAFLSLRNGAAMLDSTGASALRDFNDNLAGGTFFVGDGEAFTSPGAFTNAGIVETEAAPTGGIPEATPPPPGKFNVPSGASYTQIAGATQNDGVLTAGAVDIRAGSLSGSGTINSDVAVADATLYPGGLITGNLTLSAGSRVHVFIDQYQMVTQSGVSGTVTLAGNLEVEMRYENYLASTTTFKVLIGKQIAGTFRNAPDGTRIVTSDGRGSFVVHYDATSVTIGSFEANPPPQRLLNISTRGFLKSAQNDQFGDSVLTGGFIISGSETKRVVLRGIGPSLAGLGVASPVQDPRIDLYGSNRQVIASNDNWRDTPQGDLTNAGLAPEDYRESAIVADLAPGTYTVALRDVSGAGGNALVEIYDLTSSETSKLVNISTRGFLDPDDPLIGGIIARAGQGNAELVVRAVGPDLRHNGVFDAVDDPTLELRDVNGAIVAANDDWFANFYDIISELQPSDSADAAMHVSLPAGNYTAIVRAKGSGAGQALVEFYDLRR